jgi:ribose/xylose/arabinose/galactoside ABC-type transport system permease subunit
MSAALSVGLQPAGVPIACAAALIFGALTGAVNGLLVTRARVIPFIATLGTMTVVRGLVLTYTRQEPISGSVPWFSDISNGSIGPVPIPAAVLIGVFMLLHLLLTRTRFGRNLYAAGGNREACKLAGIRADYYVFWSFVCCGVLAALAGVLLASRLNAATIHIGQDTPLLVLTASVLGGASLTGGRGSALGTALGILTLGVLANGMNLTGVPNFYQIAIRAILLIVIVVVDALYATRLKQNISVRAMGAGGASRGKPATTTVPVGD